MGRVGNKPIEIPKEIKVNLAGQTLKIEGPKGKLSFEVVHTDCIEVKISDNKVLVSRKNEDRQTRQLHGLYRALIASQVSGVQNGFSKTLELVGVGYKAAKSGKNLTLALGYSHPIEVTPPEGVEITTEGNNKIIVSGVNKQMVGQVAANIKALRPVEPYKGKGIRYAGQAVRRKAGKAAKAAGGAA